MGRQRNKIITNDPTTERYSRIGVSDTFNTRTKDKLWGRFGSSLLYKTTTKFPSDKRI